MDRRDLRDLLGGKDCQLCEPEECPAVYAMGDRVVFQGYSTDPTELGRSTLPTGQELVWLPPEVIVEAHNTTRQRGHVMAVSGPEDHPRVQVWGGRIVVQGYTMRPEEIGKAGLPEGERLVWLQPSALAAAYEACEREGLLCPA